MTSVRLSLIAGIFSLFAVFVLLTPRVTLATPTYSDRQYYTVAYQLFSRNNFVASEKYFRAAIAVSSNPQLIANSLYLIANCQIRLGHYERCYKTLKQLAQNYPSSTVVHQGYVTRFAAIVIKRITAMTTYWNYERMQNGTNNHKQPIYVESVPINHQIERINFKLAFGLYHVLQLIDPSSPAFQEAHQELISMLNTPITIIWMDQKAGTSKYGHPNDFFSELTVPEEKHFSMLISKRMFYHWKTNQMYQVLVMFDDVRDRHGNFTARGAYHGTFTLHQLFQVSGYNPFTNRFKDAVDKSALKKNNFSF
jgi:tetratricopeptide (TPR) repeat protein